MKTFNSSTLKLFAISFLTLSILAACGDSDSTATPAPLPPVPVDPEEVAFSATLFNDESASVSNEYFLLKPGRTYVYEGFNDEGELERVEVNVSHETRLVDGVESRIVVDRNYDDGDLVEETFDWYAQDMQGNVWYMGEDSVEIEDGEIVTTAGSWESGLDIDNTGNIAVAGIIMKTAPFTIGDTYKQEIYPGVAEDTAQIVAVDVAVELNAVTLPDGSVITSFTALQTLEWVPLDPDPTSTEEHKYFAPGYGQILETNTEGGERVELIAVLDDTMPNIQAENFSNPLLINNKYFPLVPGTTYRFETSEGEDEELILYEVLDETRQVMGITTRVVRDRVYIDGDEFSGVLVEDTRDWFAQDDDGNVWYMGEDVDNYDDDGVFTDHDGAWEAGIDDAQPGIQMKANPLRGDSYHQEYLVGEAEDLAAIVQTDALTLLGSGAQYTTLKVKEWNPLEEDTIEYKYYAAGLGFIREEKIDDQGSVEEAIEFQSIVITQTFENLSIHIENNEEENEAQVILAGSAEPDFFKSLQCFAPNGVNLLTAEIAEDSGDYADFQYDTAKTELSELALSYPQGLYWCMATTPEGNLLMGSAELSNDFSTSLTPIFPVNGSENLAPNGLTLSWEAISDAQTIVVDIENTVTGDSVEIELDGEASSFAVPDGLLVDGSTYHVGFEVVHESGNAMVLEDYSFSTQGDPLTPEEESDDFGDFENLQFLVVYNATDNDAQVIIEAEAQDDTILVELNITDPLGEVIHQISFEDKEDLGITDVLYESSEPSIIELEEDFPAGEYTFNALLIDDSDEEVEAEGKIILDYLVLPAPMILFPLEEQAGIFAQEPMTISWSGIDDEAETIILEIEADESGQTFSVELPIDATEFTVPADWLSPDTVYVIDLEVEHENGNLTAVDVEFRTEN